MGVLYQVPFCVGNCLSALNNRRKRKPEARALLGATVRVTSSRPADTTIICRSLMSYGRPHTKRVLRLRALESLESDLRGLLGSIYGIMELDRSRQASTTWKEDKGGSLKTVEGATMNAQDQPYRTIYFMLQGAEHNRDYSLALTQYTRHQTNERGQRFLPENDTKTFCGDQ